jgi:hypothetical protein
MSHEPNSESVRRIVLPSGRSIEVVKPGPKRATPAEGLHVCQECGSELVQPLEWGECTAGHWEMTLQCPNCRWTIEGFFTRDQVDQFEERLDDGLSDLLSDLRRLTEANMTDEIEQFVSALELDQILPEDF